MLVDRTARHAELREAMDFDVVIFVDRDGSITTKPDIHAPELTDDTLYTDERAKWSLMTGYTGQYCYNGPIMHESEYIGGKLADDILATPGLYVALVNSSSDESDLGWAVATIDIDEIGDLA
jgi:hypothetical protein